MKMTELPPLKANHSSSNILKVEEVKFFCAVMHPTIIMAAIWSKSVYSDQTSP